LISISGAHNLKIDNVEFRNSKDHGISGNNVDRMTVTNSWFHNLQAHGIGVFDGSGAIIGFNQFNDLNGTDTNEQDGFGVILSDFAGTDVGMPQSLIIGNNFNNTGFEAIAITGSCCISVIGNSINHTGDTGISINRSQGSTIMGNNIANTEGANIIVTNSTTGETSRGTRIIGNVGENGDWNDSGSCGMIGIRGYNILALGNKYSETRPPPARR